MLNVPIALQAHLDGEATSHCYCWKLVRTDGVALGFTDHDEPLEFDGLVHAPQTGFSASGAEAELGLSMSTMDVEGALSSSAIDADDIRNGRYDAATVETWLVNWQDVSQRLLMRNSIIGRIELADGAFKVELKSLAAAADRKAGRLITRRCDAQLGDARCGVAIEGFEHNVGGTVSAVTRSIAFLSSGIASKPARWAENGKVIWTSGANTGAESKVILHETAGTSATLTLAEAPTAPIVAGDTFTLRAGCSHTFEVCKVRFANGANFRGFPHLPGDEAVYAYPNGTGIFDGGVLVP